MCTGARRLCLIMCAVLATVLLVSSISEATQPRTPHPNPMVTRPQAQQPKCNQECNSWVKTDTGRRSPGPALMLLKGSRSGRIRIPGALRDARFQGRRPSDQR
jgi:hypothetical protein